MEGTPLLSIEQCCDEHRNHFTHRPQDEQSNITKATKCSAEPLLKTQHDKCWKKKTPMRQKCLYVTSSFQTNLPQSSQNKIAGNMRTTQLKWSFRTKWQRSEQSTHNSIGWNQNLFPLITCSKKNWNFSQFKSIWCSEFSTVFDSTPQFFCLRYHKHTSWNLTRTEMTHSSAHLWWSELAQDHLFPFRLEYRTETMKLSVQFSAVNSFFDVVSSETIWSQLSVFKLSLLTTTRGQWSHLVICGKWDSGSIPVARKTTIQDLTSREWNIFSGKCTRFLAECIATPDQHIKSFFSLALVDVCVRECVCVRFNCPGLFTLRYKNFKRKPTTISTTNVIEKECPNTHKFTHTQKKNSVAHKCERSDSLAFKSVGRRTRKWNTFWQGTVKNTMKTKCIFFKQMMHPLHFANTKPTTCLKLPSLRHLLQTKQRLFFSISE